MELEVLFGLVLKYGVGSRGGRGKLSLTKLHPTTPVSEKGVKG